VGQSGGQGQPLRLIQAPINTEILKVTNHAIRGRKNFNFSCYYQAQSENTVEANCVMAYQSNSGVGYGGIFSKDPYAVHTLFKLISDEVG